MTFGEIFKDNRKRLCLTQEEIALRLMVTPQAVSKWETNQGSPDISLLIPISEEFGITVDELLGKSQKSSKEIEEEIKELRVNNDEFINQYKHLQKMIKSNPTNTDVLLYLLETSVNILKHRKSQLSDIEKSEYVKDAEIYAKTLIERGDRSGWDKHGYGLLAQVYMYAGDYERAKKTIENLPWTKFNRFRSRGDLAFIQNDYETARMQYCKSLQNSLSWMFYELRQCSYTYCETDVYKSVIYLEAMYKLHKTFFDYKAESAFIWQFMFACMELAVFHANYGDKDKAFEFLEEYTDAVEIHQDSQNTKTTIFPQWNFQADKIDYNAIKKTLTNRKGLTPLRQEQRFHNILERLKIENT